MKEKERNYQESIERDGVWLTRQEAMKQAGISSIYMFEIFVQQFANQFPDDIERTERGKQIQTKISPRFARVIREAFQSIPNATPDMLALHAVVKNFSIQEEDFADYTTVHPPREGEVQLMRAKNGSITMHYSEVLIDRYIKEGGEAGNRSFSRSARTKEGERPRQTLASRFAERETTEIKIPLSSKQAPAREVPLNADERETSLQRLAKYESDLSLRLQIGTLRPNDERNIRVLLSEIRTLIQTLREGRSLRRETINALSMGVVRLLAGLDREDEN